MSAAGLFVAFSILLFTGFGLTQWLAEPPRRQNGLECVCLAWMLGAGVISLLLWGGGFLLAGVRLQMLVTLGALTIGFSGWRSGCVRAVKVQWPRPGNTLEWLLAGLVALAITATVLQSLGRTLGWDGSFNWETKARFAFLNGGVMPVAYYSSGSQISTHPEYPLFIPMTQLWLDLWVGQAHQFWAKAVLAIFNAAGVTLLALLGARLTGRGWMGGVIALLFLGVPYLARGAGGITSGYLDLPLGLLYLAAIGYLLLYEATGDLSCFRFYAATLALLPWCKREGTVLWLVGVAAGIAVIYRGKANSRLYLSLLPGAAIIAVWQVNLKVLGTAPAHDFMSVSLTTLGTNLHRFSPICKAILMELGQVDHWSIFWLLAALAFLYQLARGWEFRFFVLWMAIAAPVLLYGCSYVFSAWPDYLSHVRWSLPRLLLQVTPVAWLAVALALTPRTQRSREPSPPAELSPNEEPVFHSPATERLPAS